MKHFRSRNVFKSFSELGELATWPTVCPANGNYQKMLLWCNQQESTGRFHSANNSYWRFEFAEDALLFSLMWGSAN